MSGIFQRILSLDLTKGRGGEERLPLEWYTASIGGHGLGLRYLFEDLSLRKPLLCDPILIMTGPLTGSPVPATSRASLVSYSHETKTLKLGTVAGRFPAYLKLAGFDGLVLTGRAPEPVRVRVGSKGFQVLSAGSLWGKEIPAVQKESLDEWNSQATLAIGPAGESGSVLASIIADGFLNTSAGLGMELGNKRLKILSVEGDTLFPADPETELFSPFLRKYLRRYAKGGEPGGEVQRSCFACVGCCGCFLPGANRLVLQDDLRELKRRFPRWSEEKTEQFYVDCLDQGLEPFAVTDALPQGAHEDIGKDHLMSLAKNTLSGRPGCMGTRSWEDALVQVHGGYRDRVFEEVRSIPDLVRKENLAMVKRCLPVCDKWEMSPEEMANFLTLFSGRTYAAADLEKIGESLIDETMNFFGRVFRVKEEMWDPACSGKLPSVLRDGLQDYLSCRKWPKTGYPGGEPKR